jgi:hypothetical protein
MSNVNYKCVSGSRMGQWQKLAEEHAANGVSFMVRPFNKQVHWAFLQEVCQRYDLVARFNAVDKSAFFDPRSKAS